MTLTKFVLTTEEPRAKIWPKQLSHDMRFSTMWYLRPAKAQTSLRKRAG